jgi:eukaryotic-like serine/threonine-protein kinase
MQKPTSARDENPPRDPAPSAPHVGPYRLLRRLGAGGMGEVFLAERVGPVGFVKQVVVKRLLPHREVDPDALASFLDEARLSARMLHPNVVQVLELGEAQNQFFIAMEYLPGASLRALLDATRVAPALAGWICAQALHGLHHAHELKSPEKTALGLVHRDVSPENVLLGISGSVKVADFGLAKAFLAPDQRISGVVRGKVDYMPPEQLQGRALDRRADVYAMGAVLYELLSGHPPFRDSPERIAELLSTAPAPPLLAAGPVGEALSEISLRALQKRPEQRFTSAEEMAKAIEAIVEDAMPNGTLELRTLLEGLDAAGQLRSTSEPSPSIQAASLGAKTRALPAEESSVEKAPGPRRLPFRWRVAGSVILLAVVAGVWGLRSRHWEQASPVAPRAEPSVVVVPPPAPPKVGAAIPASPSAPVAPSEPVRAPHVRKPQRPGQVVFRAHPWAEVFLDGKSLGTTPMSAVELPAGKYVFTFRNKDLSAERRVTAVVQPGVRSVVKASMLPPAGP